MDIKLTNDQLSVYNKLLAFMQSESKEIRVIGYAGSGKTVLMTKLVYDLLKEKKCKKIAIAAPTHKAINVFKSKMSQLLDESYNINKSKKIGLYTIQRLLNYTLSFDENGKKIFTGGKSLPNVSRYDLIIIDESSMLSEDPVNDIENMINSNENKNVKVIYVGDPAQLPPVGEECSSIFKKNITSLTLDKIIRTENNNIMNLSNDHRKWIIKNQDKYMPKLYKYNNDENINIYNKESNSKEWLKKFMKYKKEINDNTNSIILTWTNKNTELYNTQIRNKLFNSKNNKKQLNKYEIGEILVFNDHYRIVEEKQQVQLDDNGNEEIVTVPMNTVFHTSELIKLMSYYETIFTFNKLKNLTFNDDPDINTILNNAINDINALITNDINIYIMTVEKNTDDGEKKLYDIKTISESSQEVYNNILNDFELIMNTVKSKTYKCIKKKKVSNKEKLGLQLLLEKIISGIYTKWANNVIDNFASLIYGYSMTVHKSQGSTFNNVFIDMDDIMNNNKNDEMKKCLYTAITRTSKTLNILL